MSSQDAFITVECPKCEVQFDVRITKKTAKELYKSFKGKYH